MSYELTINRVMGLCAFEVSSSSNDKELKGKALARQFYEQMDDMFRHRLDEAYKAIEKEAKRLGAGLESFESKRRTELDVEIFRERKSSADSEEEFTGPPAEEDDGPSNRLVGLFKSRRFEFKTTTMVWDLRVRPSLTACALQRPDGLAKLWWTFEGVPLDAGARKRPTEEHAVEFIEATSKLAHVALPVLRKAYRKALQGVSKRKNRHLKEVQDLTEEIRVSLADNNGLPFARLVDAMHLKGASFKDILNGAYGTETAKGAHEVREFITATSGQAPDDDAIRLSAEIPGIAAVYSTMEKSPAGKTDQKVTVVSGLASSVDMITGEIPSNEQWRRINNKPDLVRTISAARPLSAKLANEGALRLDRRVPEPATTPG